MEKPVGHVITQIHQNIEISQKGQLQHKGTTKETGCNNHKTLYMKLHKKASTCQRVAEWVRKLEKPVA